MSAIPVIDIAALIDGSPEQARAVAAALGRACREVGFFYITGHGVPPALRASVFDHSAAFFTGPASIREAASFSGPGGNRGYIRLGGEALDPDKPADVKEAFNIGLELASDDPELLARVPFRAANLWPDVPGFRETMLDYFNRVWRLGRDLHRGFALDLGLDPDFFEARLDKPIATLRLLHYPPVTGTLSDGQLGAGVHTDYGNVTLLATDAIGGLMVQDRSGRWLDAPVIPDAFVCNIGDCLMRWSNDVYVSTPHKVVSPPGADRYSVAFFLDPNPDAMVACLPTCISPERPAKYAPITGAEFLRSRLEPTYAAKAS
ncbi:2-oxoglutarate and iron-dependent oxygenase domain-containing protein [Bradyrhizobium sp. dw_78]|uniref:isopenicillin N synthase family dioxygenase n=1 Tax=Bradyrhizobium sp. dw_78 TaxID=2719793 RepID=UPI001BD4684F|nr:2-oxoglutarate and iron-dependent oxygenase domain-containing protein [Bradyrhizobium sp. dw_78]